MSEPVIVLAKEVLQSWPRQLVAWGSFICISLLGWWMAFNKHVYPKMQETMDRMTKLKDRANRILLISFALLLQARYWLTMIGLLALLTLAGFFWMIVGMLFPPTSFFSKLCNATYAMLFHPLHICHIHLHFAIAGIAMLLMFVQFVTYVEDRDLDPRLSDETAKKAIISKTMRVLFIIPCIHIITYVVYGMAMVHKSATYTTAPSRV